MSKRAHAVSFREHVSYFNHEACTDGMRNTSTVLSTMSLLNTLNGSRNNRSLWGLELLGENPPTVSYKGCTAEDGLEAFYHWIMALPGGDRHWVLEVNPGHQVSHHSILITCKEPASRHIDGYLRFMTQIFADIHGAYYSALVEKGFHLFNSREEDTSLSSSSSSRSTPEPTGCSWCLID